MTDAVPTAVELADLLATILTDAAGGTYETWIAAIGEVEKLPTWANVRSNWKIHPVGRAAELDAIQKAAEVVRSAHPYVAG